MQGAPKSYSPHCRDATSRFDHRKRWEVQIGTVPPYDQIAIQLRRTNSISLCVKKSNRKYKKYRRTFENQKELSPLCGLGSFWLYYITSRTSASVRRFVTRARHPWCSRRADRGHRWMHQAARARWDYSARRSRCRCRWRYSRSRCRLFVMQETDFCRYDSRRSRYIGIGISDSTLLDRG